jgi:hypothetical protein
MWFYLIVPRELPSDQFIKVGIVVSYGSGSIYCLFFFYFLRMREHIYTEAIY